VFFLGHFNAAFILTIAGLVLLLYKIDMYYLEKGPQKYLKNFDQGEIKEGK